MGALRGRWQMREVRAVVDFKKDTQQKNALEGIFLLPQSIDYGQTVAAAPFDAAPSTAAPVLSTQ